MSLSSNTVTCAPREQSARRANFLKVCSRECVDFSTHGSSQPRRWSCRRSPACPQTSLLPRTVSPSSTPLHAVLLRLASVLARRHVGRVPRRVFLASPATASISSSPSSSERLASLPRRAAIRSTHLTWLVRRREHAGSPVAVGGQRRVRDGRQQGWTRRKEDQEGWTQRVRLGALSSLPCFFDCLVMLTLSSTPALQSYRLQDSQAWLCRPRSGRSCLQPRDDPVRSP